jgi:hypothetical protein
MKRQHPVTPLRVYIDTNGFSDLFREKSLSVEWDLRRRFRAAGRAQIRFETSAWTIEELGGIAEHDWLKYRRVMRYVFRLVGPRVLHETRELLDLELQRGRRLRGKERYLGRNDLHDLRRATGDRNLVRQASAARQAKAEASVPQQRELRQRSLDRLGRVSTDPRAAAREWATNAPQWIDEWSRDLLASLAPPLGYNASSVQAMSLARVPTVVNFVGMSLARIAWYVGEGRRVERGDDADLHHYAAACYADAFVTGDSRLRQIVERVPRPPVRPTTMAEFATTYFR